MGNRLIGALAVVSMLAAPAAAESEPEPAPASTSSPWKTVFFVSLGVTVGLGVVATVSRIKLSSEVDQIDATKVGGFPISDDDCNSFGTVTDDRGGHFQSACAWRSRGRTATYMAMSFAAITAASAILAFAGVGTSDDGALAVTPSISPDGAGASLQLRF